MPDYEVNFLDRLEYQGPYDGMLLVLNVANGFEREYEEMVFDRLKMAHARNWAVIYASIGQLGAEPPPEHYDYMPSRDFPRLITCCGRNNTNLSLLPAARMDEIRRMAVSAAHSLTDLRFRAGCPAVVLGRCSIGGQETLIPPVELKL